MCATQLTRRWEPHGGPYARLWRHCSQQGKPLQRKNLQQAFEKRNSWRRCGSFPFVTKNRSTLPAGQYINLNKSVNRIVTISNIYKWFFKNNRLELYIHLYLCSFQISIQTLCIHITIQEMFFVASPGRNSDGGGGAPACLGFLRKFLDNITSVLFACWN